MYRYLTLSCLNAYTAKFMLDIPIFIWGFQVTSIFGEQRKLAKWQEIKRVVAKKIHTILFLDKLFSYFWDKMT